MNLKRSNLLTGMALLVLVATGPAFAVLLNFQHELQREREVQARTIAQQRAQLVGASLGDVIEGTRQMMAALSVARRVRAFSPACTDLLGDLRADMPAYIVLVVARQDGTPVCSAAATTLPAAAIAELVRPFVDVRRFTTGSYTRVAGFERPLLTFALPLRGGDASQAGVLVAGLDLAGLGTVLAGLEQEMDGRLIAADRTGRILASAPQDLGAVGRSVNPESVALLGASGPGAAMVRSADGLQRVVGYIAPGKNPAGLYVSAGFNVADLVGGIDHAANRGYLLISLSAALSVLLALFLGHHYLRAPASVLLDAAQRWGSGDLTGRADWRRTRSCRPTGERASASAAAGRSGCRSRR